MKDLEENLRGGSSKEKMLEIEKGRKRREKGRKEKDCI